MSYIEFRFLYCCSDVSLVACFADSDVCLLEANMMFFLHLAVSSCSYEASFGQTPHICSKSK